MAGFGFEMVGMIEAIQQSSSMQAQLSKDKS